MAELDTDKGKAELCKPEEWRKAIFRHCLTAAQMRRMEGRAEDAMPLAQPSKRKSK